MAHVLIIDDKTVCSILSEVIKHIGHEHAHNLGEGLREALAKPYDVVFLDVRLPGGNGLDALQEILEARNLPEVVIITGATRWLYSTLTASPARAAKVALS